MTDRTLNMSLELSGNFINGIGEADSGQLQETLFTSHSLIKVSCIGLFVIQRLFDLSCYVTQFIM